MVEMKNIGTSSAAISPRVQITAPTTTTRGKQHAAQTPVGTVQRPEYDQDDQGHEGLHVFTPIVANHHLDGAPAGDIKGFRRPGLLLSLDHVFQIAL